MGVLLGASLSATSGGQGKPLRVIARMIVPKQPPSRHSRQIPRSALNDTPLGCWGGGEGCLLVRCNPKGAWGTGPDAQSKPKASMGCKPIHAKRVIQSRRRGICLGFTLRYGLTTSAISCRGVACCALQRAGQALPLHGDAVGMVVMVIGDFPRKSPSHANQN